MVICLERGADLHTAQLMPLPLTVSCSSKIQIGFTFLVPAHLGGPGERAVKRVCGVCARKKIILPDSVGCTPLNPFPQLYAYGIISATSELAGQLQQKFKFNLGFDDRQKAGHV